jgi:hypothetical protein
MITISHKSGPLAGETRKFDDDKTTIEIGRETDCDIVYPEDEALVGRKHLALVGQLKDWVVHIHEGPRGPHFVSIDGVPAESGQIFKSGAVFHLGRKDGPSFSVNFDQPKFAEGMAATIAQAHVTPTRVLYRRLALVGGVVAVAIILVLGGWIAKYLNDQQRTAAAFASLAQDQENAKNALAHLRTNAAATIDQKIIDHLINATFLVYKQDAQGRQFADGTAWVIGPDVLATNAHISALCSEFTEADKQLASCDDLSPGEKLLVKAPGPNGAVYEVIGHSYHPGYVAFPRYVLAKDPAIATTGGPTQVGSDGYDVGLLKVNANFPPDLALQVASKEELMALTPGTPLASAGYPSENIYNSDVLTVAATPQIHYGNISALTDSLFLPTDPAHNFLIQHSVPMTGGSSGSPVVSVSGHVIGLLNSANFGPAASGWVRGAPSGAEINYAQRADFVADLLAGRADSVFQSDMTYWAHQVADFQHGIDVMGAWVLDRSKPNSGVTPQLASETHGKLTSDEMRIDPNTKQKIRINVETLKLTANTSYLIFVYADDDANVKIYMKDANNNTLADNTNSGWYPSVSFVPPTTGDWSLVVVGPDDDTTYTTRVYTWKSTGS